MSCSRMLAPTRWEARKRCSSMERIDMVSRSAMPYSITLCGKGYDLTLTGRERLRGRRGP